MSLGLEPLNVFLNKNPAANALVIVVLFAIATWNSYQTQNDLNALSGSVYNQTYDYSYRLITRGFAGSTDGHETLAKTIYWRDNGWDAQLTALDTLCDQPERARLLSLVDHDTAVNICRVVR